MVTAITGDKSLVTGHCSLVNAWLVRSQVTGHRGYWSRATEVSRVVEVTVTQMMMWEERNIARYIMWIEPSLGHLGTGSIGETALRRGSLRGRAGFQSTANLQNVNFIQADNAALVKAAETGRPILPVYILDDKTPGDWTMGGASRWWLEQSLLSLDKAIADKGGRLCLRRGDSLEALKDLAGEVAAHARAPPPPVAA